jgi:hypothetical protein
MNNGPKLNTFTTDFTTRDSLGVESVATGISDKICPIINTVTPRPFYWAFMCWIYYDYYSNIKVEKRTYKSFDQFLKRQDYFFVLSQLLIEGSDRTDLVGTTKAYENINKNISNLYECDRSYFITQFGGMQYFNAGLFSMGYIFYREDENGKKTSFPTLTADCEKIALAFQNVIKDTKYFKNIDYRLKENPVPKDVLIEYGKKINLSLKGFDECKAMLRESLFSERVNNQSYKYALFLSVNENIYLNDRAVARNVLYDYYSPRGDNRDYPQELKEIINNWEIVIGRQYFASSLELTWKYMLSVLERPKTKNEWIQYCLEDSTFDFDINDNLSTLIKECDYNFDEREDMIKQGSSNSKNANYGKNVSNGIRALLSVYNRFNGRTDLSEASKQYLHQGYPVSISELINLVKGYMDQPIYKFISYTMDKWLIDHHYFTALEKLYGGRDGFYFELTNGYYFKKSDFSFEFQRNRFIQLMQVMKDLDLLNGGVN